MRKSGTLQTWNDDRGFGFISPLEGNQSVFVHISEFPKDGSRPTVGERLTYVEVRGRDDRFQATKVERSAFPRSQAAKVKARATEKGGVGRWLAGLIFVALLAGAAKFGYQKYEAYSQRLRLEKMPVSAAPAGVVAVPSPGAQFACDGRIHCAQMTSCAEATWFINHCPGTKMDGNHDGIPCEQQWCTQSFAK